MYGVFIHVTGCLTYKYKTFGSHAYLLTSILKIVVNSSTLQKYRMMANIAVLMYRSIAHLLLDNFAFTKIYRNLSTELLELNHIKSAKGKFYDCYVLLAQKDKNLSRQKRPTK